MNFIHEITGNLASLAAYVLAGTGLVIYFFKYVRKAWLFDRKKIVKAHLYATVFLAAAAGLHYVSTDKSNFFVMAGLMGFAAVALAGLSLRIKKLKGRYFKKVIAAKVIVLALAASFLFIGHAVLEKERKEHRESAVITLPS